MNNVVNRIVDSLTRRVLALFDEQTHSISTLWSRRLLVSTDPRERDLALGGVRKTAILVQGPVYLNPHSTLEICVRYCTLYPDAHVVFSTWDDQDVSEFLKLSNPNFHLVTSEKPRYAGPSNINLQIKSTSAGIVYIESLDVNQILKTRSDIFIFSETFLHSCDYYLNKYNVNEIPRILVPSFNSFLFREYSLTDQIMYGSVKALREFWSCNYVNAQESNFISEEFLIKSYLGNLGIDSQPGLKRSLEIYRDFFIVIDSSEFNLVWNKGTRREVLSRYQEIEFPNLSSEITYSIWLRLQEDIMPFVKVGTSLRGSKPH